MQPAVKIELSFKTRRGGFTVETLSPAELEPRIMALFKQRLDSEAWVKGNREHVVGQVFKRDGRWQWWMEIQSLAVNQAP